MAVLPPVIPSQGSGKNATGDPACVHPAVPAVGAA
jgi:hypothetical protein